MEDNTHLEKVYTLLSIQLNRLAQIEHANVTNHHPDQKMEYYQQSRSPSSVLS